MKFVWLSRKSRQTPGGYLLLSLISHAVKSHPSSFPNKLPNNFKNIFNKYKSLICHHVLKAIESWIYMPGPYTDAHARARLKKEQAKLKEFKDQLELGTSYERLTPEFKKWIEDASNWYFYPRRSENPSRKQDAL